MTDVDFDALDEQTRRETARIVADDVFTPTPATMTPVVNVPVNTSGITPIEFKVLILPDPVEEVTKGGIIVPVEKVTKDEYATTTGRIVAVAHAAFAHVTDDEWGGDKPKVGDHVVITKYAGFRMKGPKDGVNYFIVRGEDIHAKIED